MQQLLTLAWTIIVHYVSSRKQRLGGNGRSLRHVVLVLRSDMHITSDACPISGNSRGILRRF